VAYFKAQYRLLSEVTEKSHEYFCQYSWFPYETGIEYMKYSSHKQYRCANSIGVKVIL